MPDPRTCLRASHLEYLDFEPLERAVRREIPDGGRVGGRWSGDRVGLAGALTRAQRQAYYRARERGRLTWQAADKLACALGLHPSEVWEGWAS